MNANDSWLPPSPVLSVLSENSTLGSSAVASGLWGSPLADLPAAASAPRGASYAGRRVPRGGRQRGVGGRGGDQAKANPKAPKNPSFKRGFQE